MIFTIVWKRMNTDWQAIWPTPFSRGLDPCRPCKYPTMTIGSREQMRRWPERRGGWRHSLNLEMRYNNSSINNPASSTISTPTSSSLIRYLVSNPISNLLPYPSLPAHLRQPLRINGGDNCCRCIRKESRTPACHG